MIPDVSTQTTITVRVDADLKLAAHRAMLGKSKLQAYLQPVVEAALRRVLSGETPRTAIKSRRRHA